MEVVPLLIIYGAVAWFIAGQARKRGFSWSKYFWINLVLGAIGWIVTIFMWRSDRSRTVYGQVQRGPVATGSAQRVSLTGPPENGFMVSGPGHFSFDVVGESKYLPAIRSILEASGEAEELVIPAVLEPEPTNNYDNQAIRVVIRGATVGYIPKTNTGDLHPVIQRLAVQGKKLMCNARVFYGYSYGEDRVGSVRLDLRHDLSLAVPANELPAGARLWPDGSRLQAVIDTDSAVDAQAVLQKAYQGNQVSVYCELTVQPGEKGSEVVAISIEGKHIGTLSQASSKKFAEFISKASSGGSVYSRGVMSGNRLAANLHLLIKRPEELSSDEIRGLGL